LEIKKETGDTETIWAATKHEETLSDVDDNYCGSTVPLEEDYKLENTDPYASEENPIEEINEIAKPMVEVHTVKRKKEKKTVADKKVKKITRKPCQCYICGKEVKRLSAHLLFHSQDRKHSCDICGRAFVFKGIPKCYYILSKQLIFILSGNLCQHINTHLMKETKNFACDMCEKTFITNSALRKHTKVHSGKDNVHCEICSRGFNRAATLRMHVLQVHQKNHTHFCHLCEKKYYSS
jgi:hypothetical protein